MFRRYLLIWTNLRQVQPPLNRRECLWLYSDCGSLMNKALFSSSLPLPLICERHYSSSQQKYSRWKLFPYGKLVLGLVGLGAGVSLGVSLQQSNTEKRNKSTTVLPTVMSAFPFGKLDDIENPVSGGKSESNRKKYNFIADVVEKVSDGVVYIDIKDHRRRDIHGKMLTMSNGSGFVLDSDGLILTNAHVVSNKPRASTIMVRLPDGREFEGRIEELDAISDLALVRIPCKNLTPVRLGTSSDLRPGEFVVAVGSPLSLSNTITSGVVSSVGRPSKELGLRGRDIQYIQTDAAITFGNSGGPLVNLDGEVIGISSMKVTSGISFAIPIDYAKEFIAKFNEKKDFIGKYKHPESPGRRRYLGITMLTLTPEILLELQQRSSLNLRDPILSDVSHGILVWRVVVGSPAYHAGLSPGDIVTHINGHEVTCSKDVYKILEGRGDLHMVVIRGGQKYSVTVSPEE